WQGESVKNRRVIVVRRTITPICVFSSSEKAILSPRVNWQVGLVVEVSGGV
ncbi:MAG: hypothetical protein ACI91J_004042, partial [Yoonia sp.]